MTRGPQSVKYAEGHAFAERMDAEDPLREFRSQFNFPLKKNGYSPVYFCGNSLGLQPKLAQETVQEAMTKWADKAVDGHFDSPRPWLSYHREATDGLARLTGARPLEVVAMNTLTVNLHMLMASFYQPSTKRRKILIEAGAFPSDRYAVMSQLRLQGFDPEEDLIEWPAANDAGYFDIDDLARILASDGDSIALVLLPGVQYYTGQVLDMAAICELGRNAGCNVGLDLAHAIGNVELHLHDWAPDFAAWCAYKYVNAGPGAIAGVFIHDAHFSAKNLNQLHGWWGNDEKSRFDMSRTFAPAAGAEVWQVSCPPVLSLAPLIASLDVFDNAGLPRLVEKSRLLTGYLSWFIEHRFGDRLGTITPEAERGCQLSLIVTDPSIDAKALYRRLCDLNVIGDWREPNVIRMAPAPLYNSFDDVFQFADRLDLALRTQ